jgi:hypothetical protein
MSSRDFKCEYCSTFHTTRGNLEKHQRTTKKCIEIQKARGLNVKDPVTKCPYCNKDYSLLNIKRHIDSCVIKSSHPTQINNTNIGDNNGDINIQNIQNNITNITLDFGNFFTDEKVTEIFQEYKSEHALEQMKGLAKFIIEKVLLLEGAPGYYVRDAMRNIFAYDTENGIKYDDKGELLRKKINDGASDHINDIVDKIIHNFSSLTGKKNEETVEDMKDFKKDIRELNTTTKLMTSIKKDYGCKNKEQRVERINKIKDSKNKVKVKVSDAEKIKKIDEERQLKIKFYKFNLDKDRKDHVLSKGTNNEPLSFTDKPLLEELNLKYTDFFLEDL